MANGYKTYLIQISAILIQTYGNYILENPKAFAHYILSFIRFVAYICILGINL